MLMHSVPNRNTKISCCVSRSPESAEIGHFTRVVVLQKTAKKCTKNYNAHAKPLFGSLTLLFGDVLVAVDAMLCVRS